MLCVLYGRAQNDSFHSSLVAPVLAKFIGHGDVNSLLGMALGLLLGRRLVFLVFSPCPTQSPTLACLPAELMSELQQLFPGVVNDYAYTQLVQSLGEHEHPAAGDSAVGAVGYGLWPDVLCCCAVVLLCCCAVVLSCVVWCAVVCCSGLCCAAFAGPQWSRLCSE